ncbi:MAG: ABC transporter substrate-binding protein [Spirulina sp. DLM2.Bin59]|nr:MAG: ABC transporter substrate-binding protein [Spirulina sp. DLM2.Bin59]
MTILSPAAQFCRDCGQTHFSRDHAQLWAELSPRPLDWVNPDGAKPMGPYSLSPDPVHGVKAVKDPPSPSLLASLPPDLQLLIAQMGGLESVLRATFGQGSTHGNYPNRRKFLQQMLIGALLMGTANCGQQEASELDPSTAFGRLEKTHLKIAYLPIACATPIIMAEPLGFYEKYGLKVELVKMNGWPQVRDAAMAGELDAYHMLSPMPLAMSLGLSATATPIKLASIENINGSAITVALRHRDRLQQVADLRGFRIAVPYIYSMHNLLLRYHLASGGIHPDRDAELIVLPPPEMLSNLEAGTIDAMVAPEPFNQMAVEQGVGFIHRLTRQLWPGHPCCAFATSEAWMRQYPSTFRAVNKAIIDSTNYASQPQNRRAAAQAVAPAAYLNVPLAALESVFTGEFNDGLGNRQNIPDRIDFDPYPWKSFSYWITTQLQRWGFLTPGNWQHEAIADDVFMTGLARQLSKELGQNPPSLILRFEDLAYDRFDPSEPEQYLQAQIDRWDF